MSQQQHQQKQFESADNFRSEQIPTSADGWAAQLASDRNNYQPGTHQQQYHQDLGMAQSYVNNYFPKLELTVTGTQDGHLVGVDRQFNRLVSLTKGTEVAIGSPSDGQWKHTGSDHMASLRADGSGAYQVGQFDRSGEVVARSILKDRGMGADPSDTQVANFQRDLLVANGRKVSDTNWYRHLQPGQVINVPAGQHAVPYSDSPYYPAPALAEVPPVTPGYGPYADSNPAFFQSQTKGPYEYSNPNFFPPQLQLGEVGKAPYVATPDFPPTQEKGPYVDGNPNYLMLEPGQRPNYADAPDFSRPTSEAAIEENKTETKVDNERNAMDSGYGFLRAHYRGDLTTTLIGDAMNRPDANDQEKLGMQLLQDNLSKVGNGDSAMTFDQLGQFETQQQAATWRQAGKDNPALGTLMKQARDAYSHFAPWYGPINAHNWLTSDLVDGFIGNGGFSADMDGLKFLQRHFHDMKQDTKDPALLQWELDAWTKLD